MGEKRAEHTSGEPQVDAKLVEQFQRLSGGMAIAVICLAVVVLTGASIDKRSLLDFGTGASVASAAAALCFILAGTALLTAKKTASYKNARPLGLVCSIAIIIIGSISLLEQLVGWSIISESLRANGMFGLELFTPDLISANTAFSSASRTNPIIDWDSCSPS